MISRHGQYICRLTFPFACCAAPTLRVDSPLAGPAMLNTIRLLALRSPAMVLLRRLPVPELGLGSNSAVQLQQSRGGRCFAAVRAVWQQDVLWTEAPVADVGIACEEYHHFVLDISGYRELMEEHTKAGQFVQLRDRSSCSLSFSYGSFGSKLAIASRYFSL